MEALNELYWLKVRAQNDFQNTRQGLFANEQHCPLPPDYLVNLPSFPNKNSRHTVHQHNLTVPQKTREYECDQTFFVAKPKLLNKLPNIANPSQTVIIFLVMVFVLLLRVMINYYCNKAI